jgi:hypothetical protein
MQAQEKRIALPFAFAAASASLASTVSYLSGKVFLTLAFSKVAPPQALVEMSPTHNAVLACVAMGGPLLVCASDEIKRIKKFDPFHGAVLASYGLGKAVAVADYILQHP